MRSFAFITALLAGSAIGAPLVSRDDTLIQIVNKWRTAYGLGHLTWDENLVNNAFETGRKNGGVSMQHFTEPEHPGTWGQVIAWGFDSSTKDLGQWTPFEIAYVAGWLCEVEDPQIVDTCNAMKAVQLYTYTDSEGNHITGHHDLLTSDQYTTIGCAFFADPASTGVPEHSGIWTCDLGGLKS